MKQSLVFVTPHFLWPIYTVLQGRGRFENVSGRPWFGREADIGRWSIWASVYQILGTVAYI